MKKYTLTCLPLVCAAMASLCADNASGSTTTNGGQQASVNTAMGQITPPALPAVKRSADPFLTAEYIYWKAAEEGLAYAVSGLSSSETTNVHGHGSVHKPDFGYDSGFKVGFGLKFRHDSWDMYANYTWLFSDGNSSSTTVKSGQTLNALWYEPYGSQVPIVNNLEKAENDWAMHFNALDLELGRNYNISPRLTLRPHFGLKLAWIDQDMGLEYDLAGQSAATVHQKFDQDKFGVGIRAGFNTAWFMWVNEGTISQGFSVYGNFAASAIYSDFDVHEHATYQDPTGKFTIARFSNDCQVVTPVLEWSLGLRYQTDFYHNNYEFMIQAGWEEQVWFNENKFSNLSQGTNGNLTLQGLTVKVGFSF